MRAKFVCNSVTQHGAGKVSVDMRPAESPENKTFWSGKPAGSLQILWADSAMQFEAGKEYYLDITDAAVPSV